MSAASYKLVILISGSGSNLQAIIDAIATGFIPATITVVISNKADAYGLKRAEQAHIPTHILDHKNYPDRQAYDQALLDQIDSYQPDLIVLAGFMRILGPEFVHHFAGKIINIHPSLLPKYPGLHTHTQALANGDSTHGATIHFVTAELDGGPIIAFSQCQIHHNDTEILLQERVHKLEHVLYPTVIRWFAEGRIQLTPKGILQDGIILPNRGVEI